jgi:ribosomal 50S subunit-recycling heat shock protein
MRLDKFLKYSGIVRRRGLAKRICDEGLVQVDGRAAKPSTRVSVGDRLRVQMGLKITDHEILALPQRPIARPERPQYVRLLSSERLDPLEDL